MDKIKKTLPFFPYLRTSLFVSSGDETRYAKWNYGVFWTDLDVFRAAHATIFNTTNKLLQGTRSVLELLVSKRGKVHEMLIKGLFLWLSVAESIEGQVSSNTIASIDTDKQITILTDIMYVYVCSMYMYRHALSQEAMVLDDGAFFPSNKKKQKKSIFNSSANYKIDWLKRSKITRRVFWREFLSMRP